MMKKWRLCTLFLAVIFTTTACGPILSTSRRADAEDALHVLAVQGVRAVQGDALHARAVRGQVLIKEKIWIYMIL